MELEFNITQPFNDDLGHLSLDERENVGNQINKVSQSFINGKTTFNENSSIPYIFNLKGGLDSSLYLIRMNKDKRIVAAVDEDPIFDKVSFTLFRVVDKKYAEKVYKEVGVDIYSRAGLL